MVQLSKAERETLRLRYGGFCAYCGDALTGKWHVDHVEAVKRNGHWKREKCAEYPYFKMVYVHDGTMSRAHNDHKGNLAPACVPCNMSKGDKTVEQWRKFLQAGPESARRDCPVYKHAVRFGLIVEIACRVEFWFERYTPRKRFTIKE